MDCFVPGWLQTMYLDAVVGFGNVLLLLLLSQVHLPRLHTAGTYYFSLLFEFSYRRLQHNCGLRGSTP